MSGKARPLSCLGTRRKSLHRLEKNQEQNRVYSASIPSKILFDPEPLSRFTDSEKSSLLPHEGALASVVLACVMAPHRGIGLAPYDASRAAGTSGAPQGHRAGKPKLRAEAVFPSSIGSGACFRSIAWFVVRDSSYALRHYPTGARA